MSLPQDASAVPNAPAKSASSKLSVKSCLTTRVLPAPIAVRMAISRPRVVARARRRFATFTQAISSTKPTAIIITTSAGRIAPVSCSCSDFSRTPKYLLVSGYCLPSEAEITSMAACACGRVIPGLSLAMQVRKCAPRCCVMAGLLSELSCRADIVDQIISGSR